MTVTMEPEPDIMDAIDRMGLQERGTLRAWMIRNHDAFMKRLERFVPDWMALAEVFAKAGLTDRRGHPPTGEAARKTWQRVRSSIGPQRTPTPIGAAVNRPTEHAPDLDQSDADDGFILRAASGLIINPKK